VSTATELFTSGTAANASLMAELSDVADELQKYEDAGVVAIWRPWMEMNMEWNWVYEIGPDAFKRLWRMGHEYFTTTRGLDNLLWLYGPTGLRRGAIDWYPGDEYVDILAPTLYADFIDDPGRPVTHWFRDEFYPWAVTKDKPIGLSEYGRSVNEPFDQVDGYVDIVEEVQRDFPAIVFIRAWNDGDRQLGYTGTPTSNPVGVMAHSYVLTRDEVVL
jgi:mannan endo-1,4-beta-mannosidase